ncbi:MAG: rubrerythrin family protein [bacterium]|nr:rubrerythrin family protein [bacterium]
MPELKNSKTEKNLLAAFAGECQASSKYAYFAAVAKKEGYERIAAIFQETSEHERMHAKQYLKLLNGIGTTLENLRAAAGGEREEWEEMYPRMAAEARAEGFEEIARLFEGVAKIEKDHQARYAALLKALEENREFEKPEPVKWRCRKCGFVYTGTAAIEKCPVCGHPRAHFEVVLEQY